MAAADAVVTMTDTARDRLLVGLRTSTPRKVSRHPARRGRPRRPHRRRAAPRPHLLTWGLLGPGKGIEWALRALAAAAGPRPAPIYTVAGRTHPKVLEREGEAYRAELHRLGAHAGRRAPRATTDRSTSDPAALGRLIRSADVVVLPYDSREQVTSGVLIEAVAAGIPVVATTFPHAVELLTDGPGLLVPHQDPAALAAAVRRILTEPGLAATPRRPRPAARRGRCAGRPSPHATTPLARRLIHAERDRGGRGAR